MVTPKRNIYRKCITRPAYLSIPEMYCYIFKFYLSLKNLYLVSKMSYGVWQAEFISNRFQRDFLISLLPVCVELLV